MAKVAQIHKKESKLDYKNYQPISLLSVLSKIYEKVLYKRIYGFLSSNNLLYEKQYDFQSSYSTDHALISLTEKIKKYLDNGYYIAVSLLILTYGVVVSMFDFHCSEQGSNPSHGGKIS